MRIAVVHSFYSDRQPSGENVVVLDQVRALSQAGHEVRLVARHTDDVSSLPRYRVKAALASATGVGESPSEVLSAFRPEVVHVHNTFPNWGTRWLRDWGPSTVTTVHNYRPMCANGLLFRDGHSCVECLRLPLVPAVRHRCYRDSALASVPLGFGSSPVGGLRAVPRLSARVVALNDEAAAVYSKVFDRTVDVVPNFVPRHTAQEIPTRRWVYVGRLGPEKGIDMLLRDWPEGEELDVIGDGPLRDAVAREAERLPGVRLLGLLDRSEILSQLPAYTGLILPSMCAENLPTVILEALSCGVPVILSEHIKAAGALTREGVAEQFRPGAGTNEVVRALRAVESLGGAMRASARKVHEKRYSEAVWLQAIGQIYKEVATAAGEVAG